MPSIWVDKCCLCIPLRVGTFIIGYLLTVINSLFVVITTMNLVHLMKIVIAGADISSPGVLTAVITQYSVVSLFVIRLIFSIALLVGLHMRKLSLVKIFYIGYSVLVILYLILFITSLVLYGMHYRIREWLILLPDMTFSIFSIYSIFVVSRWYKVMKNQGNITPMVAYNAEKRENDV